MFKKYDISNNIADIQNSLIDESIRETSNVALLKSEDAIRDVIKSYSDKFNAVGGKLTNITKHYANSKDIIDKKIFNDLFDSLYIDIKTLYKEIENIDNILNLNLSRNKKFFFVLKKRMRELWNKLNQTRIGMSDSSSYDESYFESFSSGSLQHKHSNILIDKKTGLMSIEPRVITTQNKKYLIKSISSQTFPAHNEDGGVIHTTNYLNTFPSSYRVDGQRDMLENGLWKEQIFTREIPEIRYNITGSDSSPMWINFIGIISLIDIEYVYPVEINNIIIDVFGEHKTGINAILYKVLDTDDWSSAVLINTKKSTYSFDYIDDFKPTYNFDIIDIKNIQKIKAKYIRLVFNQQDYELIDSTKTDIATEEDKINNDLSERRYEVVKLDGGSDDKPAIPKSYDNDSLYSNITDIIENAKGVEETLLKIIDVLEPKPNLVTTDFTKTLKYELGAWEIKPTLTKYEGTGIFNSGRYKINNKSLMSVNLTTKQNNINSTTCNWFISSPNSNINIPILENNENIRKEKANIIRPKYYEDLGWTKGFFIQLDFPMDIMQWATRTKIYIDGTLKDISEFNYYVFNSTLIYFDDITDQLKKNYVIQYIPDLYGSVNVYTLEKIKGYVSSDPREFSIVSPRKAVLFLYLNSLWLENEYNVKKIRITNSEFYRYFPTDQNLCVSQTYRNIESAKGPIEERFYVNIVNQFRSVTYTDWLTGNYDNNISDSFDIPSAIPIQIERDI